MSIKKLVTVLVLGAGGNVSQGIIKALRQSNLNIRIIGACISEFSKGLYMCDEGYICPYANDQGFVPWVVDFCNQHDVDIILTGVEENIIALAKQEPFIKENTKAVFISSSYEQLKIGQDKFLTCQFLEQSGCNYPKYQLWESTEKAVSFAREVGFPIIAKPRNGKSSKGIHIFRSEQDILSYELSENYVLEQCIGSSDSEYTVGCYVNKFGNSIKILTMQRRLANGTTIWAKTVDNKKIEEECIKICKCFKPVGPFNIQLRLNKDGIPVCFELNVRFSGTTAIRSRFGFKDVKAMLLEYLFDSDITDCFDIKHGEVFRYDEEFYITEGATDVMREKRMIPNVDNYLI